ncbi:MAG: hypothetical protein E7190_00410 [Erysipelotrichaceae bacterium]|nr:hypothetical protein [Erysipelotrichaceae bacterium]
MLTREEYDCITRCFNACNVWGDVHDYWEDDSIGVDITWGDWKHDHLRCDWIMEELGYALVEVYDIEENGSDCYSATRRYRRS